MNDLKLLNNIIKYNIPLNYEDDINRTSLILLVELMGSKFICNRNSDQYNNVFNDKYVRWWESKKVSKMCTDDKNCNITTLIELPFSNYNLKDQKNINIVKKIFINEFNLIDKDVLSNKLFNECKENYRYQYCKMYNDYYTSLLKIDNLEDKIYEYGKKIFYKKGNEIFFTLSREEIWNIDNPDFSKEQKIIFIILRDYIKEKKQLKCYYPFIKGSIKNTINKLINISIKLK